MSSSFPAMHNDVVTGLMARGGTRAGPGHPPAQRTLAWCSKSLLQHPAGSGRVANPVNGALLGRLQPLPQLVCGNAPTPEKIEGCGRRCPAPRRVKDYVIATVRIA